MQTSNEKIKRLFIILEGVNTDKFKEETADVLTILMLAQRSAHLSRKTKALDRAYWFLFKIYQHENRKQLKHMVF